MKKQLLIVAALLLTGLACAQQGLGGIPKGDKVVNGLKNIPAVKFSEPNIDVLRAEDEQNDITNAAPWRFGFNNEVNLNISNSGEWYDLPNGGRIWLLKVTCENALTVNLTFNETKIPEGNELYVYNEDKSFILGKFVENHLYDGELGSELVPGSTSIVEYYVAPENRDNVGNVQIYRVTHGYRTALEYQEKAFGSSGSCNMNVNCADGAPWTNQRNSVVMLVSGSSGFCTGSLINNTLNDGKPYVLTANHCYSAPASWIFRFNWQATGCTNPGASPTFTSLSGAVLRARRTPSDMCLVEITGGLVNNTVPLSNNPYFNGWDNSGAIPTSTVCIHHPSGDIKKIAFDDASASISQEMGSTEANSTWTVEWDRNTTTEGGSSGSPLFDQNHRVIGQLWGGGASCSNLSAPDYYGRVSISWQTDAAIDKQLKHWLDPTNTGASFIDGYDPNNSTPIALNAGLNNPVGATGVICDANVTPSVTITNTGTTTLTSALILYGLDGNFGSSLPWTGSLSQWQTAVVAIPTIVATNGAHVFNAQVVNPNSSTDEVAADDITTSSFTTVINGETVTLNLDLDCWASETSWELTDATNTVLYSGDGYSDGDPGVITEDFCLPEGCYNFKIMDSYGDGMTSCSAANGGTGNYQIVYASNTLAELLDAEANFGTSNTKPFCVEVNSIDENVLGSISMYPNPANQVVNINAKDVSLTNVEIYSVAGQLMKSISANSSVLTVDVSSISAGVYFVKMYANEGSTTRQLVIK
ncbi:MAG: T9SS type A sorting domain-containing protein [Bacteroidota bacterium]